MKSFIKRLFLSTLLPLSIVSTAVAQVPQQSTMSEQLQQVLTQKENQGYKYYDKYGKEISSSELVRLQEYYISKTPVVNDINMPQLFVLIKKPLVSTKNLLIFAVAVYDRIGGQAMAQRTIEIDSRKTAEQNQVKIDQTIQSLTVKVQSQITKSIKIENLNFTKRLLFELTGVLSNLVYAAVVAGTFGLLIVMGMEASMNGQASKETQVAGFTVLALMTLTAYGIGKLKNQIAK